MATIPGIRTEDKEIVIITWTSITTSDTGGPVDISGLDDITIHSVGSGTPQYAGSNNNSNFVSIGSAAAANSLTQIAVHPRYFSISAMTTNTATVILVGKRRGK